MQSNTQNWFYKHELLSKLTLALIAILMMLFVTELALRLSGKKAGFLHPSFELVDQLDTYQNFLTDNEGVFKANPNFEWSTHEQYKMSKIHINSDGFRSIEFEQHERARPKILFLGDSFTWGASAKPITNSFVDIVSRQDYLVFNTGIPAVGPSQYAYLAEKYIPVLKPDIVAVMFYMGNDLWPSLPMLPHKNIYYFTNAGALKAFDKNNEHLSSAQEAYNYHVAQSNLAQTSDDRRSLKNTIRQIVSKSVIGTYAWIGMARATSQLRPSSSPHSEENREGVRDYTKKYLKRIESASKQHGARLMLFLIPVTSEKKDTTNSIEENLYIFEEFSPFAPTPGFLTQEDYMTAPDRHFNNDGHQKYADFILGILENRSHGSVN